MESKKETQVSNSYLTIKLGQEEFGVHVNQVLNILEMTSITEVPKSPSYMKGVINLRGTALPIIDLRMKFGMPEEAYTDKTCIVVMDLQQNEETIYIGAIVDEVISVTDITNEQIEPAPNMGTSYEAEFITGMAKVNDEFIMLVDMQLVLSEEKLSVYADEAH